MQPEQGEQKLQVPKLGEKRTPATNATPCGTAHTVSSPRANTMGSPVHPSPACGQLGNTEPLSSLPPYFGKSNTREEHVNYGIGPYIHCVPMTKPSAVPTAPGVHLSSGCQGQVVVAVGMGSNFDNVSRGKTLDQLWGLKG